MSRDIVLSVAVRLLLRYIAGALGGIGGFQFLSDLLTNDPDAAMYAEALLTMALSAAAGLAAEGWYRLAKRRGWPT